MKKLLLFLLLCSPLQAALTDNLISYWALDEASGTRVDKVTASANNLTPSTSPPTQTTGLVYPNAALFDQNNSQYFSRADNASLSTGGTAFTVIAWIYLNITTDNAVIAAKDDQDMQREWVLYHVAAGVFEFITWTGSGTGLVALDANTAGNPSASTWYMVAAVADQTTNKISVNAGTQDSISAVNAGWNSTGQFNIGANLGNYMEGRLGPVVFWKRALTPTEITQVYNGGAGMTYAAMTAAGGNTRAVILSSNRRRQP